MKVFISWSGDRSKHIAEALRGWFPNVLQALDPWMSDADIEAGDAWDKALSDSLAAAGVGIICVTPENQHAPWLQYEAGALSRTVNRRVCPLLYDMELSDLTGSLTRFQFVLSNKAGMLKVLKTLNKNLPEEIRFEEARVQGLLNKWWGELDEQIKSAPGITGETPDKRDIDDKIDELLDLARAQIRPQRPGMLEQALSNGQQLNRYSALFNLINLLKGDPHLLEKFCADDHEKGKEISAAKLLQKLLIFTNSSNDHLSLLSDADRKTL